MVRFILLLHLVLVAIDSSAGTMIKKDEGPNALTIFSARKG